MKAGIMQPYFFPYLGYFSLIAATDIWIYFDTPQYIRHGWVNRNRILKPSNIDWQYIVVPVAKHSQNASIKDIVPKHDDWKRKIMAQLEHYKKKAKYYKDVKDFLIETLNIENQENSLAALNIRLIKSVCNYCGLEINDKLYSTMGLNINQVNEPDEWALGITSAIGANIYVNPTGGIDFFDRTKYDNNNIELKFLRNNLKSYAQQNNEFIPGLSIIDVMMHCSSSEVLELIKDYEFV